MFMLGLEVVLESKYANPATLPAADAQGVAWKPL
jgi:hypothetical protein